MRKSGNINILAIETSADETSAAVLCGSPKQKTAKLLSNIVYSQIQTHAKTGGIVPEVAARVHIPKIIPAIKLALKKANASLNKIDVIAVTTGPGLITSLMIGVDTAKALAFALKKPIISINHLEGHLLSSTSHLQSPVSFPALGLLVSGGHTILALIKNIGRYKILGQTLDDAAGECFDKVAKLLGLPYPGGPALSKLAEGGNPKAIDFPRPMIDQKNFDFSFSGLKTAVLYFLRGEMSPTSPSSSPPIGGRGMKGGGGLKTNIAASVEQAIVDVLVAKTLHAAKQFRVKTILLGGGVAANKKLRKTLGIRIKKEMPDTKYLTPNTSLTGDNAGMIALAAFWHYIYGATSNFANIKADPNLPLKSWR